MAALPVVLAIVLLAGLASSVLVAAPAPSSAPAPAPAATAHGSALPHPPVPPTEPKMPFAGAQGRLIVSTSDPSAVPNDGLRLNVTPFSEPPLGPDASFQAAVEETIGGYDAVFGLFANTGTAPIPFFSVFSNTTDSSVHLAYWPTATTFPGTTYDFELTRANGTVWELDVNHQLFAGNTSAGQFDFQATGATWAGGLSFSEIALYPATTSAPATFSVPLTFAVHRPSGWYLPQEAHATFAASGGPSWGVEGRLQHPTLPPGEIVSGTSLGAVANGTVLWTGGPLAVGVVLTTPSSARSLSSLSGTVSVTSASGAPVSGATLFLSDRLGGNFSPASVVTGGSGSVGVVLSTPNVSANSSDLLTAIVTTFGYTGLTESTVELAPATQIVVRAPGGDPAVAPGATLALSFSTADTTGGALSGVYLTFAATLGTVAPAYGVTGSDGSLVTTLVAPNVTGPLTVRAVVSGEGIWGAASVNVTVRTPTAVAVTVLITDVAFGAILVAVVLAAVWILRRRRAGRPPVPAMRLPRPPATRPAPSRTEPAVSRTPRGGDAP